MTQSLKKNKGIFSDRIEKSELKMPPRKSSTLKFDNVFFSIDDSDYNNNNSIDFMLEKKFIKN